MSLTGEWIKKMWCICTMGYYSVIKKNETLPFAIVDGDTVYCAKRDKSARERQIPYDFTHMWSLRNKTDEYIARGTRG